MKQRKLEETTEEWVKDVEESGEEWVDRLKAGQPLSKWGIQKLGIHLIKIHALYDLEKRRSERLRRYILLMHFLIIILVINVFGLMWAVSFPK